MATGTGRLSARAPNLQQVPRGVTHVLDADGASLPSPEPTGTQYPQPEPEPQWPQPEPEPQ